MLVTSEQPDAGAAPRYSMTSRYTVRPMTSDDFPLLQKLESEIWGSQGELMLCPHYLRLCVEQFGDVCFLAFDGDRPVGYVLNILRGKVAHCGTLAVLPDYRRTRVTFMLIAAMTERMLTLDIGECWFTVSPENDDALAVHMGLGAHFVAQREHYYGPGDTRLLGKIDLHNATRLQARFSRRRREAAA